MAHCLIDIGFIIVSLPVYTHNLLFEVDTSTGLGQVRVNFVSRLVYLVILSILLIYVNGLCYSDGLVYTC